MSIDEIGSSEIAPPDTSSTTDEALSGGNRFEN
jgi:hypothetical protein